MSQKPLRWDGLVSYVGKFEVGRVQGVPGHQDELFVSMLDSSGLTPLGKFDWADVDGSLELGRRGKKLIEENWEKIARLMYS